MHSDCKIRRDDKLWNIGLQCHMLAASCFAYNQSISRSRRFLFKNPRLEHHFFYPLLLMSCCAAAVLLLRSISCFSHAKSIAHNYWRPSATPCTKPTQKSPTWWLKPAHLLSSPLSSSLLLLLSSLLLLSPLPPSSNLMSPPPARCRAQDPSAGRVSYAPARRGAAAPSRATRAPSTAGPPRSCRRSRPGWTGAGP